MTDFPDDITVNYVDPDFDEKKAHKTLFQALTNAARREGMGKTILQDTSGNPATSAMSYRKLLTFINILSARFVAMTQKGERVGVLMPNVNASLAIFFALSRLGRTPAMIHFIVDPETAYSMCQTAGVKTVITARGFLDKAADQGNTQPQNICTKLKKEGITLVFVDELARKSVTKVDKLKAFVGAHLDMLGFYNRVQTPEREAVILFTSGSEGEPKGVALSHINILANHLQCATRMALNPKKDVLFNALPNFHCFGLLTATLLPLFRGVPILLHNNPKDADKIPGYFQQSGATLSFATDSFLAAYASAVLDDGSVYDKSKVFAKLNYIWAGAEALKERTRKLWKEEFDVDVLQGYGVTETSPVISFNDPRNHKPGTVGQLVGGTHYALTAQDGIDEGGELHVKGPHVMLGYLYAGNHGKITPLKGGWHATGDIVSVGDDGFMTIKGRLSRFIKVKGEKVPLSVCEHVAKDLWHDASHGAGKCLDEDDNETIILFTTQKNARLKDLEKEMQQQGISMRHMPKDIKQVEEIPTLGNGKADLKELDKLAAKHCG